MILRSAARTLLVVSLSLPVVQAVLVWVAGLLTAMGDATGAAVVRHIATACLVVWTIGLVGLLVVLSLVVLSERPPEEE